MLASPRRRRRLAIAAAALAIGLLVFLGVHYSTAGSSGDATGPYVDDSFYRQPKQVPFTAENRHAVKAVLAKFIDGAVAGRDLAHTWQFAGPSLRQDLTRRDWVKGDTPIVPFAAAPGQGNWSLVNYSYRNKVGLELLLFPEKRSAGAATVQTDLVRGRDGRWRVDYWLITKMHGPGSAGAVDAASALSEGPPNVHKLPGQGKQKRGRVEETTLASSPTQVSRLDAKWMLVPLALLSLIVVVPIVIGTNVWLRNRRAAAEYRARSS